MSSREWYSYVIEVGGRDRADVLMLCDIKLFAAWMEKVNPQSKYMYGIMLYITATANRF